MTNVVVKHQVNQGKEHQFMDNENDFKYLLKPKDNVVSLKSLKISKGASGWSVRGVCSWRVEGINKDSNGDEYLVASDVLWK